MHQLLKIHPNVKLGSLCIPASHDSASDTISPYKAFSAIARTQNISVSEQLKRGIRSLDIRMATSNSSTGNNSGSGNAGVGIFHGCLLGAPLFGVLLEIADFLYQHPSEFIFCELVPEFNRHFTARHKKEALDMIQECLGPFLYKNDCNAADNADAGGNCNKLLNELTLQLLVQANTRVCVLLHPRIYKDFELDDGTRYDRDFVARTYHCFDSNKVMHNQWHNTRNVDLLLQWNLEEMQRRRGPAAAASSSRDKAMILVNQFIMTPGVGGPADIFKLLFGLSSLRPISFAVELIPKMEEFFRTHAHEPWNLVMLDFIDLVPCLITFLISLNFVANLEIVKATVIQYASSGSGGGGNHDGSNETNVTDVVSKFVYRGKVLFLSNVGTDLSSTSTTTDNKVVMEGRLRIDYKLVHPQKNLNNRDTATEQQHTLEWEFDEDTQIVLSEYTVMMATPAAPAIG